MIDSVKAAVARYNMFDGATEVTVALSGGADSVALLSVLMELKDQFGLSVFAAHLNHCLRGAESDRDEQFVRELCESFGVTLFCERADVGAYAAEKGLSIELAARQVRYEFLERVSPGLVATAHTANDNIETVLHNLARGTGITGLCGIPPKRGRLIRPLISVSRTEVERYCEQKGLKFCTDSTNSDEAYTRNFIRHSIVPKMVSVNPAAVKNTALMCGTLRDDADFLKTAADSAFETAVLGDGLDAERLRTLHPALRSRCIARLYERCTGKTLEHQHISAVTELLNSGGGKLSVQNDFSATLKNGVLRFVPVPSGEKLPEKTVDTLPCEYEGLKVYTMTAEKFKNLVKFNSLLLNNAVDYDKICGKLILRGRLPGDKISLRGRNCTKTFKKLFNESKTDEILRDRLAVAADDQGVVWLSTFGVDQRVAVTGNTETILVLDESGSIDQEV